MEWNRPRYVHMVPPEHRNGCAMALIVIAWAAWMLFAIACKVL